MVYNKNTYKKLNENQIYTKDGSARSFIMDKNYIYCKDFIHLHIINKKTLKAEIILKLGADLSSDICGMTVDNNYIYIGIRNG